MKTFSLFFALIIVVQLSFSSIAISKPYSGEKFPAESIILKQVSDIIRKDSKLPFTLKYLGKIPTGKNSFQGYIEIKIETAAITNVFEVLIYNLDTGLWVVSAYGKHRVL